MVGILWDGPILDEVADCLAANWSAAQIVDHINKKFQLKASRSAVIGAISRAQRAGRLPPSKFKKLGPRTDKRQGIVVLNHPFPSQQLKPTKVSVPRLKLAPLPEVITTADQPEPGSEPNPNCTLMQLSRHTCRWPLAEIMDEPPYIYCGLQPLGGSPFCLGHSRMAYSERKLRHLNAYRTHRV